MDIGNGLKLYSVPPPGSGIILAFILNIMENYNVTKLDTNDPLMHHRLVEAFKYAYAYRSQIGDPSDKNITKLVHHVSNKYYIYLGNRNKQNQTLGLAFGLHPRSN